MDRGACTILIDIGAFFFLFFLFLAPLRKAGEMGWDGGFM